MIMRLSSTTPKALTRVTTLRHAIVKTTMVKDFHMEPNAKKVA
jgi:hypothetical protein